MGQPKAPQVTQTNQTKLGPEQSQIFDLAMPSIQSYAASTPQLFTGSGIAGFNPLEQQAQQGYVQTAAPQAGQLATQAAGTQANLMNPDFMLNPNQYVHAAADATTEKTTANLMENILPQIRSGSQVSSGQYSGGGTRQGVAEGLAIGKTSSSISDSLADMYLKNYSQGLNTMAGQVNANQGVMQQQLFPHDILSAVGGQQRSLEQATLDEQIRKFYAEQDLDLSKGQQLLNLISGMPGGVGTSTATGALPKTNPLVQGLGMASTASGLFGGGGLNMAGMK